jgi:uncharacterized protein YoaH (UPF0181 family)
LVLVQNTSKKLIDWLQSNFGGQIYLSKKETDKTKEAWMWRLTKQKDIELFLLSILPYLIIKKEQAKVLLKFVRLERTAPVESRQKAYEEIRALNVRGKSVTTNTQEVEKSIKIESELNGDVKSGSAVTLTANQIRECAKELEKVSIKPENGFYDLSVLTKTS